MKSLVLIFIFLSFSCKESPATSSTQGEQSSGDENAKTFVLGTLKLSASQSVYKIPGAPKPKVIENCIKEQLLENPLFTDNKGNKVNLEITYDVLKEKSKSIVLLAELSEIGGKNTRFSAGNRIQSQGEGFSKMGEEACEDLVTKITNSILVQIASDPELLAMISNPETTPRVLKSAIQNIRENNINSASPHLAQLLTHTDTNVAVAAAASLSKFHYIEARSAMLTLAEKLSRDKNPSYLPMLYVLADIGGAEINEYLNIVSNSHELPRVREVAKKAIEKANQKGNRSK